MPLANAAGYVSPLIDWTISLGNLINVGIFIGGLIALFYGMKGDIRILRHDITALKTDQRDGMDNLKEQQGHLNEAFRQLGTILTQVAVQDARLSMLEQGVNEMRHGEGFVAPFKSPKS